MSYTEQEIARQTAQGKLVNQHVHACVSTLIQFLAKQCGSHPNEDFSYEDDLMPILQKQQWDWENLGETLPSDFGTMTDDEKESWAWDNRLEPGYIDALEHWAVSDWLARQLEQRGEMVGEIFGLNVWGRTTSGQAILIDTVIEDIQRDSSQRSR